METYLNELRQKANKNASKGDALSLDVNGERNMVEQIAFATKIVNGVVTDLGTVIEEDGEKKPFLTHAQFMEVLFFSKAAALDKPNSELAWTKSNEFSSSKASIGNKEKAKWVECFRKRLNFYKGKFANLGNFAEVNYRFNWGDIFRIPSILLMMKPFTNGILVLKNPPDRAIAHSHGAHATFSIEESLVVLLNCNMIIISKFNTVKHLMERDPTFIEGYKSSKPNEVKSILITGATANTIGEINPKMVYTIQTVTDLGMNISCFRPLENSVFHKRDKESLDVRASHEIGYISIVNSIIASYNVASGENLSSQMSFDAIQDDRKLGKNPMAKPILLQMSRKIMMMKRAMVSIINPRSGAGIVPRGLSGAPTMAFASLI
jgi:hypothetical protein